MQFKSKDEIRRAFLHSDILEIEGDGLSLLLDSKGMNSLLYNNAFAKVCFTCSVVSELLGSGKIVYLDLDTVFTSYVRSGIFKLDEAEGALEIFVPSRDQFEWMLSDICSRMDSGTHLVVVDSLNTFYHLYDGIRIGSLNRLLSAYISLLLKHTRRAGSRLLVTSMMRHHRKKGYEDEWILAPSSKRLIEARSSVLLNAELVGGNLVVGIVRHQPLKLRSKKVVIAGKEMPVRA